MVETTDCNTHNISLMIVTIIEWFGLEGTFRGHLAQPPCSEQQYLQLDQAARSPIQPGLERFRGGASTTSLGNLCQCFTTLIVKNFFLISSLSLPSFSLKPLPLVLSSNRFDNQVNLLNSQGSKLEYEMY